MSMLIPPDEFFTHHSWGVRPLPRDPDETLVC